MVGDVHESSNWRRYMNYCREMEAIGRKLSNQEVSDEKRRRLREIENAKRILKIKGKENR